MDKNTVYSPDELHNLQGEDRKAYERRLFIVDAVSQAMVGTGFLSGLIIFLHLTALSGVLVSHHIDPFTEAMLFFFGFMVLVHGYLLWRIKRDGHLLLSLSMATKTIKYMAGSKGIPLTSWLKHFLFGEMLDICLGDIEEEYTCVLDRVGLVSAKSWRRTATARSLIACFACNVKRNIRRLLQKIGL